MIISHRDGKLINYQYNTAGWQHTVLISSPIYSHTPCISANDRRKLSLYAEEIGFWGWAGHVAI
jgi:hypothetical protein